MIDKKSLDRLVVRLLTMALLENDKSIKKKIEILIKKR